MKSYDNKFFFHPSLSLLFLDLGSGMGKNQDPGSGINILDLQRWVQVNPIRIQGFDDQKLKEKNSAENFCSSFFDQQSQFTTRRSL
jgi:hypothetical protein